MCGIFCSFSKDKLLELAKLNASRGGHSFSIMTDLGGIHKNFGKFDISCAPEGNFFVCHVQAPTTEERGVESIHPAEYQTAKLWHNGIIKDFDVTRLQQKQNTQQKWDTMLLLHEILESKQNLNEINGSFACILYHDGDFYAFRNEISPLFYDQELSISSLKFAASKSLPANEFFKLNLQTRTMDATGIKFATKENPYFFG